MPAGFLVCLAIAGCASAGKGNSIIGGLTDGGPNTDAHDFPAPDASQIDAPPNQITLSQNASETVTGGNSFACLDTNTGTVLENSYYRVFALDNFGLRGTLHVTQVDFGIDVADAGPNATQQPAQVMIGSYGGTPDAPTLDLAQVRMISMVDAKIPNGTGTRLSVPITGDVAAGSALLVALTVPDGSQAQSKFKIGSNSQGERSPGYTRAPDCGYVAPTMMLTVARDIHRNEADIILSVTGTQ